MCVEIPDLDDTDEIVEIKHLMNDIVGDKNEHVFAIILREQSYLTICKVQFSDDEIKNIFVMQKMIIAEGLPRPADFN